MGCIGRKRKNHVPRMIVSDGKRSYSARNLNTGLLFVGHNPEANIARILRRMRDTPTSTTSASPGAFGMLTVVVDMVDDSKDMSASLR